MRGESSDKIWTNETEYSTIEGYSRFFGLIKIVEVKRNYSIVVWEGGKKVWLFIWDAKSSYGDRKGWGLEELLLIFDKQKKNFLCAFNNKF